MEDLISNNKFVALIDAAVDAIFVINGAGIIEITNQAAQRLLGYSQAELLNQNIKYLMPPPYRDHHDGYLSEYLKTGKSKIIGVGREVKIQRKDGLIVQVYLSIGRFEDDKEAKFVGIIRDLSVLKQNEAELVKTGTNLHKAELKISELINHLAHASRISVMGEMAANMAHEINQPLTAISSYAQACKRLLANDPSQIDQVSSTLDKVSAQAQRATEIIQSMRNWVRNKDVVRVSMDCNKLLMEVVDIANIEARSKNIELKLKLAPEPVTVMCEPIQIQQVALNLIKNSIDAVSEGSSTALNENLTITIQSKHLDDETIQILVSDHGPGISDKVADHLFDPFITTKESGMGLGLSICKTIIRIHGGELYFQSNPEGGTNFYFELPTAVESP